MKKNTHSIPGHLEPATLSTRSNTFSIVKTAIRSDVLAAFWTRSSAGSVPVAYLK